MTTHKAVSPIHVGYTSLTPLLVVDGAGPAIDVYVGATSGEEPSTSATGDRFGVILDS